MHCNTSQRHRERDAHRAQQSSETFMIKSMTNYQIVRINFNFRDTHYPKTIQDGPLTVEKD